MQIKTTRFGDIEVSEESILFMPAGMIGFDARKRFVLLEDRPDTPFKWLQSVDEPALAFVVVNPLDFFPNYEIDLGDDQAESLDLKDANEAVVLTTVTLSGDDKVTTNLLGPIVINTRTLAARQIALDDERYGTKHVIGETHDETAGRELSQVA